MRGLRFLWLIALFPLVALFVGAPALRAAVASRTMVFEAENVGHLSGKSFVVMKYTRDPAGKVSGDHVLATPAIAKGSKVTPDEVRYQVRIPAEGTYYLWARVYWSSGCGNAFLVNLAGVTAHDLTLGGDATYGALHWVCLYGEDAQAGLPLPLRLGRGVVTLILKAKCGDTRVDQFMLTTDADERPAGVYQDTPAALVRDAGTKK